MRILIIKMSSIGDIIHTFPAILDAKKYVPDLKIDWLVDDNFIDILKLHEYNNNKIIEKIIPLPLRDIKKIIFLKNIVFKFNHFLNQLKQLNQLRQKKYDLVIDAQGLLKSAIISKFVNAKKIAGFDFNSAREGLASFFYKHKIAVDKNLHAIERVRQLFAKSLSYKFSEIDFGFKKDTFPKLKELISKNILNYIVFLHGTTWETKHWREEYWQKLGNLVASKNISIIIMTSNLQERQFAERLLNNNLNIIILSNLSILQVGSVLANATAVVGVDTGFAHLAAAIGTPVIGIYGSTSVQRSGIFGENCNNIQSEYHCSPCFSRKCLEYKSKRSMIKQPCLSQITPEIVFEKLLAQII